MAAVINVYYNKIPGVFQEFSRVKNFFPGLINLKFSLGKQEILPESSSNWNWVDKKVQKVQTRVRCSCRFFGLFIKADVEKITQNYRTFPWVLGFHVFQAFSRALEETFKIPGVFQKFQKWVPYPCCRFGTYESQRFFSQSPLPIRSLGPLKYLINGWWKKISTENFWSGLI